MEVAIDVCRARYGVHLERVINAIHVDLVKGE